MLNLEGCIAAVAELKERLDSCDWLFDLADKAFAQLWWGEGTEGKRAIRAFQKALGEHKTMVARPPAGGGG
jgi:hypothetical protein